MNALGGADPAERTAWPAAEMLDTTTAAVKSTLRRARARLKTFGDPGLVTKFGFQPVHSAAALSAPHWSGSAHRDS
jgi:hypothetical protein